MKYYRIMEYADNPVGANFYYVTEDEKEEVIKKLDGNYDIDEISKEEYEQEMKIIERKNYFLATGYYK
jgi:hypothetical protein